MFSITVGAKTANSLLAIKRELIVFTVTLIRLLSKTIGNYVLLVIYEPLTTNLRFNKKGK